MYSPQPPAVYGGAPLQYAPVVVGNEFATHPAQPSSHDFDETPQHLHMTEQPHMHQPGSFKHGLCGCECRGDCCISWWLHPVQTAKLHSLTNGDRPPAACLAQPSTFWMIGGLVLVGISEVAAFASPPVVSLGAIGSVALIAQHMFVRFRIGNRLGVRETCCCTCMTSVFCMPCSSVQMTDSLVSNGEPAARLFMS